MSSATAGKLCETPGCDKAAVLQCPTCIKLNIQVCSAKTLVPKSANFIHNFINRAIKSCLNSILLFRPLPFFSLGNSIFWGHYRFKTCQLTLISFLRARFSAPKSASRAPGISTRPCTSWPRTPPPHRTAKPTRATIPGPATCSRVRRTLPRSPWPIWPRNSFFF